MPSEDVDHFSGTEAYYAEYRPDYPDAAVEYLAGRFDLDGSARVLDLGCGPGHLAVPLAAHAGRVVGMDPNETMLRFARERAEREGVANVEWRVGSDADLHEGVGPLRLTTMGRSFHWMDQERTLSHLHAATEPGGGVAVVTDRDWFTRGPADWQRATYDVAAEYLDDLPERDTDPDPTYEDPWDEKLAAFGFEGVETVTFETEREWTADAVVGYVHSLSFCSPERLGEGREAFEADLRARLEELGDGPFVQARETEVIAGRR